ncbi:chromosome-associated kinesin KIF4A-like [Liolophura sinensis]|uniref:chromosome-associated kinesin KIF4A-like n=1 Tax=Liolophura sinensis TaxID=3198878 RepID=UPI003159893F
MPEENKVIPVRVAVRCRPLIEKELSEGCQECLQFMQDEPQLVIGKNKAFTYDYVFKPKDSQELVYDQSVKSLVKNVFKGYNGTVLAYGQTGSGKTFTMGGGYQDSLSGDEFMMGVIPRVVRDLFKGIEDKDGFQFDVRVSYLEIYNEELIDLLTSAAKRDPIVIREDTGGGIKLQGMQEVGVNSYLETMQLLENGSRSRTTGATAMNNTSSRSHAIFTIHIDQRKLDDDNDLCHVKFHLVDLAGSERAKRTKAEGERFKEGISINKGLLALGNVISALGDDTEKRNHIPYRDSKLTRILQDALGGNSHTVMVACISPADSNMEETLNTLRYADRARKIKNKPIVNRDPQAAEILRLKQVVQQLRLQLIGQGGVMSLPGGDDVGVNTSSSTQSGSEDYKNLLEKNKKLMEENNKLSKELQNSVDQSTRMCERVIALEASRDKLKSRIQELKQHSGLDLEVLSSSIDGTSNPEARQQLDKIKTLTDNLKSVEDVDTPDSGDVPNTPQSNAISTQYALRQAMLGRELQELNRLLEKKQELAKQMSNNEDKMESMRMQYENTTKSLENEIANLQKEKDELHELLENAKTNSTAHKVSEQRRKRLQELEQQMSGLKKKLTEQGKIVKLKSQSDKQVTKLNLDIQGLKQQRVKLMKQMKEDAEHFRKWKQQKDKEVLQLMQKDRKRQCEIAKLQHVNERQQTVLKRKAEEAAAANRRLKEAIAKHKDVMNERSKKLEKYDNSNIGNRVRQWLNHELEVRVSVREAKYHLDSLLKDRKTLTGQLRHLEEMLDEGPTKKRCQSLCHHQPHGPNTYVQNRMAWTGKGDSFEKSLEIEDIQKHIETLKQEIGLRNAQITDLQDKIVDAEHERKEKDTYSNIHTMVEAKCAMKFLLEQAVGARADIGVAKGELNDVKDNYNNISQVTTKYEEDLKQARQQHERQMTEMQTRYENKILFLLRQAKPHEEAKANISQDEKTRQLIEFQGREIEKLSELHDKLEKKTEECERLQKELSLAAYHDRRVSFLPNITSPGGSPFVAMKKDPESTLNTTFSMADKDTTISNEEEQKSSVRTRRQTKKKRQVLSAVQPDELNSSEEFTDSSSFKKSADDSEDSILGGIKKRRRLLNLHSGSFFSPLVD